MKIKLLTIFLLLISVLSFSQDTLKVLPQKIKSDKSILIIPFNPKVYNNDAVEAISKETGKTYDQILNFFRLAFDQKLNEQLNDTCHSISMLASFTVSANEDLQLIYSISNYVLSEAMDFKDGKIGAFNKSKLEPEKPKKYQKQKSSNSSSGIRNGEVVSKVSRFSEQFLHVKFTDLNLIRNIAKSSKVDYLLCINEFEIIANYTNPYNTGRNENDMMIKVHYSLYDASAKYLFGSYTTAQYKAYITDLKQISDKCFPEINKQIINNLPLKIQPITK
jgi:hypothetical protein